MNNNNKECLQSIYQILQSCSQRPVEQIVGYILTEDPTYISSQAKARTLIARINREELLRDMIANYLNETTQSRD